MKDRINTDLKEAMKEQNKLKVSCIKSVKQAMTDFEKSVQGKDKEITEDIFASLIDGVIKSRQKSIDAYLEAKRPDLAEIEQMEIDYIKVYLPERVGEEEIKTAALLIKDENGFTDMKSMGSMMTLLKSKFGVKAKPADISKVVKEILS